MKKITLATVTSILIMAAFLSGTPKTVQALNGNGYDDTHPHFHWLVTNPS
jgi:hypothetical protein